MHSGVLPLRPLTVGELLDAAVALQRSHARVLLATAAVLAAFRARLLAHPVVMRAVDEARPYRSFFPLGAPDRD